ncbi:MAG: hypothetical protein IT444_02095 [Phycisphaeraceae bacterium]|nr:hypothetical protein [Phycisphaeraceae bacterium]
MSRSVSTRLAWNDRWSQPTLAQLVDPLKSHHRRVFDTLLLQFNELASVNQSIIWYGPAWKWTIHYTLALKPAKGSKSVEPETLAYLVPRVEAPMVCVPLSDAVIEKLPMHRLSKFVRDGVKMAKCAVAIHWACWTPATLSEVGLIMDLVKRRHKLVVNPKEAAKDAAEKEAAAER